MSNQSIGKQGEEKAMDFLKEKGCQILEKNYRKRIGEIDIIAFDPHHKEYVFVEVKTRSNLSCGYPEESITERKLNKILKTAQLWLMENKKQDLKWRIDIIAIELKNECKIKHIQNIS